LSGRAYSMLNFRRTTAYCAELDLRVGNAWIL
jgi:hypothetical protein